MRRAFALALVLLVASFAPVAANQSGGDATAEWANDEFCEYYPQTDKYLCYGFKSYWHDFGGLEIFGYPITNEMVEDGMTVQYFQRARFEWHPGVWPERHDVLQGLLGVELAAGTHLDHHSAFQPVGAAKDGCIFYAATGHNVCAEFAQRWAMSGGLAVFGYPISEAFEHDGMLIQYFQRARFEHQPGVWPERHDVLLGLVGVEVLEMKGVPEPPPPPPPAPEPEVTVLATDLVQPRGVLATDHGVYVAEVGVGGDNCVVVEEEDESFDVCVGPTGSVAQFAGGELTRVAEGLPSIVAFEEAGGPHDVAFDSDGNMYVAIGYGFHFTPQLRDELGEAGEFLGTIVRVDGPNEFTVVADILEYEFAENPDGTDMDTNPYGLAYDDGALILADAGGNSLLHVDLDDGSISTVAVFEPRLVPAPPFIPADEIPMEAVPTNVAVGPDGNYYVSQLTGFPFPVGGARVYQVTPEGDVSVFADGFTNIGDLAFDAHGNLYVLEIVSGGLLGVDEEAAMAGDLSSVASRIVRIGTDGSQTEITHPSMVFATGISVGASGELYVVNMAVLPSAQLIRIDLPGEGVGQSFSTQMSGDEEVPPVGTAASGSASFVVSADGMSIDYEVSVENLNDVTMAHIHVAPAGENGPVVVWLYPDGPPAQHIPGTTTGVLASGTFTADDLSGPLEGEDLSALIDAMIAGNTYVNVHTEAYPAGEIRGQISLDHVH